MGGVIKFFATSVSFIAPLLLRLIWFVVQLMVTAVVSFFHGVPDATHKLAKEQEELAVRSAKLPSAYALHFYWVVRVVSILVVLTGWICWSFTTVYIVMWLVH